MTFAEFHRYEIDAALYISPFEKWAARVEKILGHDLDGDQSTDGYSLDFALKAYEAGATVENYSADVIANCAVCADCGHPKINCHCTLELEEAEEMWREEGI